MTTLANFPIVNQLEDGDPNSEYDCVPSSLAASMTYLLGRQVSPADLKDNVYGRYYVGPTSIDAYTSVCTSYGIDLVAVGCSRPQEAIQQAHVILAQGSPVVFTQQDDYAPSHPDWTHVCVWYSDDASSLTAMDPFGGKSLVYPDETWATRLRDNKIWKMERNMIPTNWKDDGVTLTAPNGITVTQGFRDFVLANNWDHNNWPIAEAQGLTPLEISNPDLGGGTQQLFRYQPLEWTSSGGSFLAWSGPEILALRQLVSQQQTQMASLQARIAQLQQTQAPNLIPVVQNLQSILSQINKLSEIPS